MMYDLIKLIYTALVLHEQKLFIQKVIYELFIFCIVGSNLFINHLILKHSDPFDAHDVDINVYI